jgi:hypothetical protein
MANKILLKKSSVTTKVPALIDLDYGELAINYTDGKLYYKTASNTVKSFTEDSSVVTLTGTQTLTNKTIDLTSNTLTGTLAQFNTALSDDDFAALTATQTLSNKTLTTLNVSSATESTTTTTGAGIIVGGLGVGGNINSGGYVSAAGDITAGQRFNFSTNAYMEYNTVADSIDFVFV